MNVYLYQEMIIMNPKYLGNFKLILLLASMPLTLLVYMLYFNKNARSAS